MMCMDKNDLMKGIGLWLVSLFMLSACNGKIKKETNQAVSDSTETRAVLGVNTLRLDSVKVTWIRDNAREKLMPLSLFAGVPDSLVDKLSLREGIPSSVSAFLVETGDACVLFDTGLGASDSRLTEGLKSLGLVPADIRYLYLTHFHGDHIGGMLKGDSVVFPNAEVYASRVEYEAWMKMPDERKAQVVKTMERYRERLHLFEFGDTLPGGVTAIDAVGHTPGHTVFRAGKLLIIADLMHGAALQTRYPEYCPSYDMDKEEAVKSRICVLKYAEENGLTMAGMHLPAPGFLTME